MMCVSETQLATRKAAATVPNLQRASQPVRVRACLPSYLQDRAVGCVGHFDDAASHDSLRAVSAETRVPSSSSARPGSASELNVAASTCRITWYRSARVPLIGTSWE